MAAILAHLPGMLTAQTISQTLSDSNGGFVSASSGNSGQSFLPSDSGLGASTLYLQSVTFYKSFDSSADTRGFGELVISTGLSSNTLSGVIGTSTNSVNWNVVADGDALTFLFANLALNASTTYVATFTTGGAPTAGAIRFQNSDVYAGGSLYHNGGIWSGGAVADAKFTATFAIPEPSSYAAIFGGLALAGAMIRRRRQAT